MGKNPDMDWTQHITMDYAQNLRKCPNKAKQSTFRKFQNSERNLVMHIFIKPYIDIFRHFIGPLASKMGLPNFLPVAGNFLLWRY